jgi:hypothetical protein
MAEGLSPVVVFAGPSLPRRLDAGWARLLDGCDLRPPARRGDVLAALARQPHTLVLLDGYYFTVPAVTHKELLYALDAGVRVIGAASLGALRAAELAPLGMTGVGTDFEWNQTGRIDGDDEVALLHAPAENGYRALTVALVEVRHAVDRLTGAGFLGVESGDRLIAAVKALSFLDRSADRVRDLAVLHTGEEAAGELARLLQAGGIKEEDARQALETAWTVEPARSPRRRAATGYLSFYKEAYVRCPPGGPGSPSLQRAWRMAQLFHPGAPEFVREIRLRALLSAAASRAALAPDPSLREEREKELRRSHLDLFGEVFLPGPEYAEEARTEILAEEAVRCLGGVEGSLRSLADSLGLADPSEESLLRVVVGGAESMPAWWLVRAFCLRPAFQVALETAVAAEEVHGCFLHWSAGARVAQEDLQRLACELWSCPPERISHEAARRGLFATFSLSEGLREALERVAAAERLPRAINAYPEKRAALAKSEIRCDASCDATRRESPP